MKSNKSFFRTVEPYLYLIPVMILFIQFVVWPFVKTIQLSFARTTPLGQVAQYVGLDNYTNIFTDGTFLNSLVTTLKFSVMLVILSIVLGCCTGWIGALFGIGGIICAVFANKQGKTGLAKSGLICSIVGIVLGILIPVLAVVFSLAMVGYGIESMY